MKIHSGLLALALLVFAGLACNFSVGNMNSNSGGNTGTNTANNANTNTASNSANKTAAEEAGGVHITEIHMAKSQDGDSVDAFSPSDRTVYVVARLSEAKPGTTVKFTWFAGDVEGIQRNSKIQNLDVTTGPRENIVFAKLTVPKDWPTGTYRVETEVNGKDDKEVWYDVK
jgi:plastocyanin